jgi:hypothetical protein
MYGVEWQAQGSGGGLISQGGRFGDRDGKDWGGTGEGRGKGGIKNGELSSQSTNDSHLLSCGISGGAVLEVKPIW